MATEISHDAFARSSVLRRVAGYALHGAECAECGASPRPVKDGAVKCRTLYNYGSQSDGYGARVEWNNRSFCSIGCFRSHSH